MTERAAAPTRNDEWLDEPCETCLAELDPAHWIDVYQSCKQGLDIENTLVNFRVSWAIALTAAFLTAESFVLGRVLDLSKPESYTLANYVIGLMTATVSAIAAWFCLRTHSGVWAALNQIDYLKHWLLRSRHHFDRLCLPAPYGDSRGYRIGHGTAAMFPLVMCGMWLLIAVAQIAWVVDASLSHQDADRTAIALLWAAAILLVAVLLELRPKRAEPDTRSASNHAGTHAAPRASAQP